MAGAIAAVVDTLGDDPRKALVLLGGVPTTPAVHEKRTAVVASLTAALIPHARTTTTCPSSGTCDGMGIGSLCECEPGYSLGY